MPRPRTETINSVQVRLTTHDDVFVDKLLDAVSPSEYLVVREVGLKQGTHFHAWLKGNFTVDSLRNTHVSQLGLDKDKYSVTKWNDDLRYFFKGTKRQIAGKPKKFYTCDMQYEVVRENVGAERIAEAVAAERTYLAEYTESLQDDKRENLYEEFTHYLNKYKAKPLDRYWDSAPEAVREAEAERERILDAAADFASSRERPPQYHLFENIVKHKLVQSDKDWYRATLVKKFLS